MRLPWRRGDRASSLDLLVVGLGNPGREYARNRHNVGCMVADEVGRRHDGSWRSKFSGRLAEVRIDDHRVGLLKPETYMNESGRSVAAAASFFKLEPDAILVDERHAFLNDAVGFEPLNALPARCRRQADARADFGDGERCIILQNSKDFSVYGVHETQFSIFSRY